MFPSQTFILFTRVISILNTFSYFRQGNNHFLIVCLLNQNLTNDRSISVHVSRIVSQRTNMYTYTSISLRLDHEIMQ